MTLCGRGLFFQQPWAIWQDGAAEFGGSVGCVDRTSKSIAQESRQIAGVVEMRAGDQNGIDRVWAERKGRQFRSRSTLYPWNKPQSTNSRPTGVSTRYREPVTASVAPKNRSVVSMTLPSTTRKGTLRILARAVCARPNVLREDRGTNDSVRLRRIRRTSPLCGNSASVERNQTDERRKEQRFACTEHGSG